MPTATWVVYSVPTKDTPGGVRAVCDERQWAAMDAARPGYFTLIRAGIAHEGEAERLARGRSGEARPRQARAVAAPGQGEPAAGSAATQAPAG
jgi:hypothetical protein